MSLEVASRAFLDGYRLVRGREAGIPAARLRDELVALGAERAPFAFEGAAMALFAVHTGAVEELRTVVTDVWRPFIDLGVGCGRARASEPPPSHPMELDGYGFQVGLFGRTTAAPPPGTGTRYMRGLGRATWFATGGDALASAALVHHRGDLDELWRGLGTACAFAGDPRDHAALLLERAGHRGGSLREGADEALRLWGSFRCEMPERVVRVARVFGAAHVP